MRGPDWRTFTRQVWDDASGVAMTEYIILVGIVGIGSAAAFITLGVAFVRSFAMVRGLLLSSFP
jgi:Flp pilus assembly pilin Flp